MISLRREAYICKRAYELASSGMHIEPITVISALVKEGYPEAADILKSDDIRGDLHVICAQSWKGAQPSRQRRQQRAETKQPAPGGEPPARKKPA